MISVVVPLYNKQESISNTIKSVLDQSFQDFEIVVVDDGSTDESAIKVNNIQDPRIRLISQNNQGVSAARNKGIKEAKYEWIAFLDGDDLWEKNHLEEITKMMNIYPDDKVFVTSFEYSDNRRLFKHERNNSIYRVESYFKEAIDEILVWTSIIVVNKNCFSEVGLFKEYLKRGEDVDLWARLAKRFLIVKSSKVTATYRIDAENRTNLSTDLKSTHIYYFDFKIKSNIDEFNYYKFVLFSQMYAYLKNFHLKCFFELLFKYKEITIFDFLIFVLSIFKNKFFVFLNLEKL